MVTAISSGPRTAHEFDVRAVTLELSKPGAIDLAQQGFYCHPSVYRCRIVLTNLHYVMFM